MQVVRLPQVAGGGICHGWSSFQDYLMGGGTRGSPGVPYDGQNNISHDRNTWARAGEKESAIDLIVDHPGWLLGWL